MRLRKHILSGLAVLFGFSELSNAQMLNLQSFNSYINNPVLVNPATVGYNTEMNLSFAFRKLWIGHQGSPRSFYITGFHDLNEGISFTPTKLRESKVDPFIKQYLDIKHFVGGTLAAEKFGPMSSYEGQLMYAIHIPFYDQMIMSLGVAGEFSFQNYKIDELSVINQTDPTFNSFIQTGKTALYDFNAGAFFYAPKFFFGYSLFNPLRQSSYISKFKPSNLLKLKHTGLVGCKLRFYRSYSYIMPMVYISRDPLYSMIYDGSIKFVLYRRFWASATYSSVKSITVTTGFHFLHYGTQLGFGYSRNLGYLGMNNNGSMEIFYGMRF